MSEEQAGKRRRRRSRAEAERLVVEFEASGISREEFCQQHGLALATLVRYRKRLRQRRGEEGGTSRWLAVQLSSAMPAAGGGAASGLTVVLASGLRIEIALGFDATTLQHLLRALTPA